MDSPFFEWESAGDPMRGWPTSNVRDTPTRRPRTTVAGGWKRSLLETPFLPLKRVKLSLSPDNPMRDELTAA